MRLWKTLAFGMTVAGRCVNAQVAAFETLLAPNDSIGSGTFAGNSFSLVGINSRGDVLVRTPRRSEPDGPIITGAAMLRVAGRQAAVPRDRVALTIDPVAMPSLGASVTFSPIFDLPEYFGLLEDGVVGGDAAAIFRGRLAQTPQSASECSARVSASTVEPTLLVRSSVALPNPLSFYRASGGLMRCVAGAIALDGNAAGNGSANRGWLMFVQAASPEASSADDLILYAFDGVTTGGARVVAQEGAFVNSVAPFDTQWSSNGLADGAHYRDGLGRVVICGRANIFPSFAFVDIITRWTPGSTAPADRTQMLLRTGANALPAGTPITALGWSGLSVNSAGQIAVVGRDPADSLFVILDDAPLGQLPAADATPRTTPVLGNGVTFENVAAPIVSANLAGPPVISNAPTLGRGTLPPSVQAGYIASRVYLQNAFDNTRDTAVTISYRNADGSWSTRVVLREGQTIPGLPAGVQVGDLRTGFASAIGSGLAINVLGQIVVAVPLQGIGIVQANDTAIIGVDPEAGVQLLHREGSEVTIRGGTQLVATSGQFVIEGAVVAGRNSMLTDTGETILRLSSSVSGSTAIVSMQLPVVPVCDTIDFDNDGLFPEDGDLLDLLAVLAGGRCERELFGQGPCNDIDINNDGLFPSDEDLIGYLRLLAGGSCHD
jgi:hypothetical protein